MPCAVLHRKEGDPIKHSPTTITGKRFAIIGPFDIENYGDHIFERVLIWQLESNFPGCAMDIFAVEAGSHGFSNGSRTVYGIDELEKLHGTHSYDAIIIAGGSIIHFQTLRSQDLRGKLVDYPIWKLWITASYVASKYSTALAWNNPEIPMDFEGWERLAVQQLTIKGSYISVRNTSSVNALGDVVKLKISQSDDCAFLLADLVHSTNICPQVPKELSSQSGTTKPIAIFHCNHRLGEREKGAQQIISSLNKAGYRVILLPLAYTNREDAVLKRLCVSMKSPDVQYVDRVLSIDETIGLFQQCTLYVGLSFHGAISTYCFGGMTVAFDYEERRKTKELYSSMGCIENYATTANDVLAILSRLNKESNHDNLTETLKKITTPLYAHFDALCSYVLAFKERHRQDLSIIMEIIESEIKKRDRRDKELATLSKAYAQCYRQYQDLRKMISP